MEQDRRQGRHGLLLLLILGLVMSACRPDGNGTPLVSPSVENVTATAALASSSGTTNTMTAIGTRTPATLPLPTVIAEVPLAGAGALFDARIERAGQRLYLTDSAGHLYVLDAVRYTLLATLPALGKITLDERHQRLYIAPGAFATEDPSVITAIDTTTNTFIGTAPGRYLAVDAAANRLFVGEPVDMYTQADVPGIRIYNGATLEQTDELPLAGVPFYNPLRNELLVMAHTVYVVDLATQQVTTDLFPELATQGIPWCNGCTWADEVHLFPEANLIAVYVRPHCMGGGCDFTGPPRFFAATTLEPLTDLARLPEVQGDCGSAKWLAPSIAGRTYRTYAFQRYITFANLMVYDEEGRLVTWRDGLLARFLNPQTAQAYLAGGDVLDLATLTPVGRWPEGCILAYDAARGLLYTAAPAQPGEQGMLRVIAQQGGAPPVYNAPQAGVPAGHAITSILPSPAYAQDQTLLVLADQRLLFRSTDGGAHWQQLRGGLPEGEPLHLQVAFSPNYGADRTLFAAGYRNEGRGEGVWRSIDGGDRWTPLWQDLTHLRITELFVSPAFAEDQTLLLRGDYYGVTSGQSGESWQQSTDGGLHWSVVATSTYDIPLPTAETLLPALASTTVTLPVRLTEYGHQVEYTPDQRVTWQLAPLPLAQDEWAQTILPAPTGDDWMDKQVIYVLSDYHLWRTIEGGRQWEQWADPLAVPRDTTNAFRSLAISPLPATGAYHLFLGTADGQILTPDPITQWKAVPRQSP